MIATAMVRAKTGSLLDVAQTWWFERFLSAEKNEAGQTVVPAEVYAWACPRSWYDAYPNLATCTWPG